MWSNIISYCWLCISYDHSSLRATIYYILLDSFSISSYTNVLENINSFWIFHSVTCDLIWWYWKRMFMQCLGKSMQQKNVILQIKAATCKISSSSCYMVSTISLLLSFLVYHHIIIPNDTNLAWLGFFTLLKRHDDKTLFMSDAMNIVQVQMTIKQTYFGLDCDL